MASSEFACLLIDADPSRREATVATIHHALQSHFTCIEAADVSTARAGIATAPLPVRVLLVEANASGEAHCRELRKHPDTESIPILFLGAEDAEARGKAIGAGADACLGRPFVGLEIATLIRLLHQVGEVGASGEMNARSRLHLAQKMDSVGHLISGLAHDYNNLLTSVIGHGYLVSADLPPDSPLAPDIQEIVDAAEKVADLTRRLMAFGRRPLHPAHPVHLPMIIREIDHLLRRIVPEHIEFAVVPGDSNRLVMADMAHVEQIVLNLVTNAMEAQPDGGKIVIEVIDIPDSEGLALVVRDDGEGMDEATLAQASQPFFTTREAPSRGMGLPMVRELAEACGATFDLDSSPQAGTRITIGFQPAPATEVSGRAFATGNAAMARRRSLGVLLVEDEPVVRKVAERMLGQLGHRVTSFPTASDALSAFPELSNQIDVVMTDMVMPHLSGASLVEKMREQRPELPVLFVSGYSVESGFPYAEDLLTKFAAKPFSMNDLRDSLDLLFPVDPAQG